MPSVALTDRALLKITGQDAQSFLQNIVTTDVDALGESEARPGALLSPHGKILFDFLISRDGDGFALDCRAAIAPNLAKRLTMYRLRAKVDFSLNDQLPVLITWGDASTVSNGVLDTRFPQPLGVRHHYEADPGEDDIALWHTLRVAHGVAESGSDYPLGDAFPHDVLLDQNGGVGFRKGCFVGQEVVSRMQHRGTARRRILVAESTTPLPEPGSEITAQGRTLGTLGTVAGAQALALVRIDRVADALSAGVPVLAGEASLIMHVPPGMRFVIPEAGAGTAE